MLTSALTSPRLVLVLGLSLAPLGGCGLIGIDPDIIDNNVADDEAGNDTGLDVGESSEGEATEGAATTNADDETSDPGETSGDGDGDSSTGTDTSDVGTGDTSDTSDASDTSDTTGGDVCEPALDDSACTMCLKDSCCVEYEACQADATCQCMLDCLLAGQAECVCAEPNTAFEDLGMCILANCDGAEQCGA